MDVRSALPRRPAGLPFTAVTWCTSTESGVSPLSHSHAGCGNHLQEFLGRLGVGTSARGARGQNLTV